MTEAQAAQAYLALAVPVNAAVGVFEEKANRWTSSTTASQASADAQPVNQVLTSARGKLLSLGVAFPPVASDTKALVNAYAPLQGDLVNLSTVNSFNTASWTQQFTRDVSAMSAAVAVVRSDLGLPQNH